MKPISVNEPRNQSINKHPFNGLFVWFRQQQQSSPWKQQSTVAINTSRFASRQRKQVLSGTRRLADWLNDWGSCYYGCSAQLVSVCCCNLANDNHHRASTMPIIGISQQAKVLKVQRSSILPKHFRCRIFQVLTRFRKTVYSWFYELFCLTIEQVMITLQQTWMGKHVNWILKGYRHWQTE